MKILALSSKIGSVPELVALLRKAAGKWMAQVLDPDVIVSERQVEMAFKLAKKAEKGGRMIARSMGTELLVRVSGSRQIDEAIRKVGAKETSRFLLVTDVPHLGRLVSEIKAVKTRAKGLGGEKKVEKIVDAYRIERSLLRHYSLEDLVLEKMALLDAET